ncbi:diacylglycerol kinase family protein [Paenibacillus brevis]|uniref:Diacylglycerol kinase family protein n=1 Tax=Paenibacillus brevis TaxID=2841508 RepID=A0ABS6FXD8_9BACL|nr:diacylglycerol kinase family protein [Paenibacillus brevis]MBU5674576.1 diacylglycerol kinase family protein [Paenibacillus brevis]
MKPRRSWSRVFRDAWSGIRETVMHERNMKIHAAAGIAVLIAALLLRLPARDMALLLLTIAMVLTTEVINTAIEAAVDLAAPEWHELAKKAKDASAGAVLIAAAFAVFIGLLVFWRPVMTLLGL